MVCAALADGTSTLRGVLESEDTQVMREALGQLGIEILRPAAAGAGDDTLQVRGAGGQIPAMEAELFCVNSGTTMRFLAAMVALGHGAFRLDGVARMRERPMGDLLDALGQLGVRAVSENGNQCPPIVVHANSLPGGAATIRGDVSSQFLSGLLMAAPCAASPVELSIVGPLVSRPYVDMTLAVMRAFGVDAPASTSADRLNIPAPQVYSACEYAIEPDASAASYFWAAAAVTGGEVAVEGLSGESLQGDVAFVDCLAAMGCEVRRGADFITVVGRPLHGIDVDMNAISDTVQTLAVVALFADGTTTIRNVAHIRHKETDRITALAAELRKLGAAVIERADGLTIQPPAQVRPATVETYNDHRMAMSFSLAGLRERGANQEPQVR